MRRKKIIQNSAFGLFLLIGLQSIASAEYRCGWLDNPAPGQYQFIDKQATWTIMQRGGHQLPATSMKNLPQLQPNEFVRTNGSFGYSCSCMSVTTDARSKRITSIVYKGKQMLLKRCLEDKTIADKKHAGLRFPGPPVSRPTNRNIAGTVPRPSGSYTDRPVIAGRPDAERDSGYYDEPKVSGGTTTRATKTARSRTNASRTNAKGRTKSHYIQVIVTSIPAKARRLKNTYAKAGYKTIINGVKIKGKLLHKVRVGPYPSRRSALNNQIKLRKSFRKDKGVQKSIIVG